jgi:cholesterol transport system auxiliary component
MTRSGLPRRRLLLAPLALAAMPGCTMLGGTPPTQIYRLSPRLNDPPGDSRLPSALLIDRPTAPESLDTDRIALTRGTTRFDYYADSIWTDRLPALLQRLLVDGFESNGRTAEVESDLPAPDRGYVLRTDVREFEARYADADDGPPEVTLVLDLQLLALPDNRWVGHRLVSVRVAASQDKLDAVVDAFDAAAGQALAQIIAWTLDVTAGGGSHRAGPARARTSIRHRTGAR